ncbi:ribonuclease H-like domain-containing protein, partial [Tanacetum coccineum]
MDIWSLGCTVIEMVTGKPPWSELNGMLSQSEGKDFLNRCLQRNPKNAHRLLHYLNIHFLLLPYSRKYHILQKNRMHTRNMDDCNSTVEHPNTLHSETKKDHSPPSTRHSPWSTLEVLPSVYYPKLNFSTRHCNILQGPNRLPVIAEGARTYSLPTTPSRETSRFTTILGQAQYAQPNTMVPTASAFYGHETILPHAFSIMSLHDPASGTWNMDTDFMTRRVLLLCDSTGDLYPVTAPSPIPYSFLVSQHTWHQCLGHQGGEVLCRLVSSNFISYNKEKPPVLCHACQLGKHVRLPFVSSSTVISSC